MMSDVFRYAFACSWLFIVGPQLKIHLNAFAGSATSLELIKICASVSKPMKCRSSCRNANASRFTLKVVLKYQVSSATQL